MTGDADHTVEHLLHQMVSNGVILHLNQEREFATFEGFHAIIEFPLGDFSMGVGDVEGALFFFDVTVLDGKVGVFHQNGRWDPNGIRRTFRGGGRTVGMRG